MSDEQQLELQGDEKDPEPNELDALKQRAEALEKQLETERLERIRVEEQAKAQAQAPAPQPQKEERLSREQLQEAVDSGKISESQRDEVLAAYMREDLKAEVSKELESKLSEREQVKTIRSQFDQYVSLRPDVKVEGTDDRRRVQQEITELTNMGYPYDIRTEVLAMRAVFGPVERVPETTRLRRESHQETGGAGGGRGAPAATGAKWEKGLTTDQIAIYRDQLSKNIYPSEDDPMFQRVTTRVRTQNQQKKAS